ncbi:hypothetical protein [Chryseobacterium luquanense]|uniref:Lipoprotein n=1 Tax=Chryseobacterium luquanense TaxID=2983766 RepID=A0ABT3Y370_9FLAO|nr:hypothetical protein [Chryseobacterium luquanense]MCX8532598.1 hypothetical protein [Chryseobacterium luquanense]
MRFLFSILIILFISSCKKDDKQNNEKRDFIVSKFNDDINKHFEEAKLKNPELAEIKEIKFYDYPKGAVNFIILNNGIVYFYNEELIWNWCGWSPDKTEVLRRKLSKDSLHQIHYNQIYSLLKDKSFEKSMKNHQGRLQTLSFSFENDTIKNFDIYKLLKNIDSLGYHSYNIRRIAPFESEVIKNN